MDIYHKRWTIELMFRHCKTNGFNLEDTHLKNLKRLEGLFAVVVSALTLVFLVGLKEELSLTTPYKKTVKTPAFSTFRRGFDFLRRLLIQASNQAISLLSQLLDPPTSGNYSWLTSKNYPVVRELLFLPDCYLCFFQTMVLLNQIFSVFQILII